MSTIKFIYMKNIYKVELKKNKSINDILSKYASFINIKLKELTFIYKGKNLSLNNNIALEGLKDKYMIIFVFSLNRNTENKKKKITNHIICPQCQDLAFISNLEDKIITKCINKHIFTDLTLNFFIHSQYIDESKIKCDKCDNYKYYYDKFYLDQNNKKICPLCTLLENSNEMIDYDFKYTYCNIHKGKLLSYCNNCKHNLCAKCEFEHKKHKVITFKQILNNKKIIEEVKNDENKINECKNELKNIINYFNDLVINLISDLDKYSKIFQIIINSSEYLDNYESIINLLNFKPKKIFKDINSIINEKNISNKIKYILTLYENRKNEMTIIYKNKDSVEIKLFDKEFIANNKKNCYLLINNKKVDLCGYYNFDKSETKSNRIVKLVENKTITNMSYMFYNCKSLLSLPDISKWNTINVTNINSIFSGCSSLTVLSDISKWNTSNITNFHGIFSNCKSLLSFPNIGKWTTKNVLDMSDMFSNCKSLKSIPDISHWNTENVTNMSNIFNNCESLLSLPDISKWNTNNVTNLCSIFSGCKSLLSLPDISKWKTTNINNMSFIFFKCSSLSSLPDISKWNTSRVNNMSYMFYQCESLLSLPDISKWNTSIVTNMSYMFHSCKSLTSLPELSKWNIKKNIDTNSMFKDCKETLNIPYKFPFV